LQGATVSFENGLWITSFGQLSGLIEPAARRCGGGGAAGAVDVVEVEPADVLVEMPPGKHVSELGGFDDAVSSVRLCEGRDCGRRPWTGVSLPRRALGQV
jgi:hypothetical protein